MIIQGIISCHEVTRQRASSQNKFWRPAHHKLHEAALQLCQELSALLGALAPERNEYCDLPISTSCNLSRVAACAIYSWLPVQR